jgi:transcriptional regulator with XRE-family HTH domain
MAKALGPLIRSLRIRAGISRHALARLAKIDPAVLARIEESARPGVQFATVARLAEALGVSLDDLAASIGLRKLKGRKPTEPGESAAIMAKARKARGFLQRALRELGDD